MKITKIDLDSLVAIEENLEHMNQNGILCGLACLGFGCGFGCVGFVC